VDRLGGLAAFLKVATTPAEEEALVRERLASLDAHDPAFRRVLGAAPRTLALEHVVGTPWTSWWPSATPSERRRVVVALLRALASLHASGRAHGDLKPEHVLLDDRGEVRVLDLGLSTPLGAPARGGTFGYLAPELLRGEPVSPASDLYALGRCLAELGDDPCESLTRACVRDDPHARPSSARAALHALGVVRPERAPIERWPAEVLDAVTSRHVVHVRLPRGGGSSALARRVLHDALREGRTAIVIEGRAGVLRAMADVCEIDERTQPTVRIARAVLRVVDPARPLVVDGVERLDEDDRAGLLAAIEAVSVAATRGTVLLLGSNDDRYEAAGARAIDVPPADVHDARAIAAAFGAPSDVRSAALSIELTAGRRGALGRLARQRAETPESTPHDAWAEVTRDSSADAAEATRSSSRDVGDEDGADADASAWLRRGAPRRAIALLGPEREDEPVEITTLRAEAALSSGALEAAARLFAVATARGAAPNVALARATVLERLGRHREAAEVCATLLDVVRPEDRDEEGERLDVRARAVAAQCALATGDPARAASIAVAARVDATTDAIRARLDCIESDAALRRGDAPRALELAERARHVAARTADPRARAHAAARIAAAHALGGARAAARSAWQAALAFAEESGDVAALPPYVMNLATADHAEFRVGEAIEGYERAAALAARLGRTASEIAALTNLGGLLATLGADREALAVLDRAEERSREGSGIAPLYGAQCLFLRAEIVGRTDPARGRTLAAEAIARFTSLGAVRQALEARLLVAELEAAEGRPLALETLLNDERDTLASAGLLGRALVSRGRALVEGGNLERARRVLDEALILTRDQDPDLHLRALVVAAAAHERSGTDSAAELARQARRELGLLAASVPPGLREAYLRAPERNARRTPDEDVRVSERRLDDSGRRLLALLSRILLADDDRILEAALDEAVALTRAERAFLLLRRGRKRPEVAHARNLDRETIRKSRFRFSRSVAERVLETGEPLITASATEDPALSSARSVLDLGLRSILVVPVRDRTGVIAALYVDHRFEKGRFGDADLELTQALAGVIGLALENARLHREANLRAERLARLTESLREQAMEREAEVVRLTSASASPEVVGGIVGRSPAIRAATELARKAAESNLGVVIEGESGTGKELFARLIHDRSARRHGPWVTLNCGALPPALLESELFGHVRGAFTDAVRDHVGVFRAAKGGTVFLDEIGELPLSAQPRLLRVLEAREVLPVGSTNATPIDVRVVCATNRSLSAEVDAGRFRRDLYYRLVGLTVTIPPLRERKEDIPLLTRAMLERIASEPGMRELDVSPAAMRALLAHEWPGNVRELLQTLRRAVVVAEGPRLVPEDLALPTLATRRREDAHRALDRTMIERALHAADGNRTRAAESLGITRVTLHRAMKRLDVRVEVPRGRPRGRIGAP
jgi:serine/threonine-protein kinase PknK